MVRVDGSNAVLMTILKSGPASTLDVITGVKALLPKLRETLPASLQLDAVGDQSTFVKAAVSSVIFEGVVAAALTGLMILIFLGSWRSTLIITISIPLAILTSVTLLAATGETINVMTLGGLALAVGILVDDATVTIENINYHLEQGKDIESAIMDGARQIVIPATVSLLCICIVFVPMFSLGGVAGYLFRPMAKAVVFALIGSYVLSRTLVNTMARFLLAHQTAHGHGAAAAANPQSFHPFPARIRTALRSDARTSTGACSSRALGGAAQVHRRLHGGGRLARSRSSPYLGRNFFPPIESTQISLHVRAPTGMRIEDTAQISTESKRRSVESIPPRPCDPIVDNIGLPISGINMAYTNSGTIGASDADILITLNEAARRSRRLCEEAARDPAGKIPWNDLRVSARGHRDADPQFRPAGADRRANHRLENRRQPRLRGQDSRTHRPGPGRRRRAHPAGVQHADASTSTSTGRGRRNVGVNERDVAQNLQESLAGSIQAAPTFWLNPKNGVSYPIVAQTPQYWLNSLSPWRTFRLPRDGSQILGGLATIKRGVSDAVVSHYAVQPVIDIFATNNERDLGAVSADIQKILDETAKDVPPGSTVVVRGQVQTMTYAYQQLFVGIALAIVLIYLLIVVNFQSWLDPFVIVSALPTALAGIVWMLFITRTTLSVPALTGAIMCMGVATANSILVVSFARERLAEGADAATAAIDAGFTRFRPVLMTALAMIIGMAPMALSDELNAPLGRAVIGGLVCATRGDAVVRARGLPARS